MWWDSSRQGCPLDSKWCLLYLPGYRCKASFLLGSHPTCWSPYSFLYKNIRPGRRKLASYCREFLALLRDRHRLSSNHFSSHKSLRLLSQKRKWGYLTESNHTQGVVHTSFWWRLAPFHRDTQFLIQLGCRWVAKYSNLSKPRLC